MGFLAEKLFESLFEKGLADLFDLFEAEGIEPYMLEDLSDDDLREIGLKLGQRKRFREAFATQAPGAHRELAPAERRQLTVVFCDLVGSTALATLLDPEDLRDVITTYLDTAVETTRRHGGHLAYTQGDGLMIYFGYPAAQEDDPVRAIRAALETVEAVQGLETIAPEPLNVRIGVATGRVVVGDMSTASAAPKDFVVGETPNLAARMQTLAKPGEVIVASSTKDLTRGVFDFETRGTAEVKGFAAPRAYFAAISEITGLTRFETRQRGGVQPIVGRTQELDRLAALWASVEQGHGQTCLIQGAPGMGKSRLLRALCAQAGTAAIEWQCAPHLSNRALHPVSGELERTTGIARGDGVEIRQQKLAALIEAASDLTSQDLPSLADLVGLDMDMDAALDAQARSRRTLDTLLRRVKSTARDGPSLVVLEDAHWADPSTLDFLEQLCRAVVTLPVMLVVTYRPEFHPQAIKRLGGEVIALKSLDAAAGLSLVRNLGAAHFLSETLAQRIIDKTDGVPLFVEELTKSILDAMPGNSAITCDVLNEMEIPATLQDSLMSRLDRLSAAKEIAQLGAVIGREFTMPMVRAIAGRTKNLQAHLRRLEETELVHRDSLSGPEYYVFSHALVQDTAYESILKSRRQGIHLKLAQTMLANEAPFDAQTPEIIARHAELGGLLHEAVEYWTLAGNEALGRAAAPAAVNHFDAALRCLARLPEGPERDGAELSLQMSMAPACMATFGWAAEEVRSHCLRAADLAKALGRNDALYGATWGLWTNYFLRGEMNAAQREADHVQAMAAQGGGKILQITADHASGFSKYFRGYYRDSLSHAQTGIARFDMETERQLVGMFQLSSTTVFHSFAAASHWFLGDTAQSEIALADALELPERLLHAPSLAFCLAFTQYTLMYRKEWEHVHKTATRLKHLADEEGFLMWGPQAGVFLGLCDCEGGDLKTGLRSIRRDFDRYAATGTRLTLMQLLPSFGEALIRNGEAEEAVQRIKVMIDDAEKRAERAYLPELHRVLGEAHFAAGNRHEGLASLKAALRLATSQGAVPLVDRANESLSQHDAPQYAK